MILSEPGPIKIIKKKTLNIFKLISFVSYLFSLHTFLTTHHICSGPGSSALQSMLLALPTYYVSVLYVSVQVQCACSWTHATWQMTFEAQRLSSAVYDLAWLSKEEKV